MTNTTSLTRDEHASARLFAATFEQSAVGMAHMHETGRFIRVNRKLCEILGYTHEALIARTFIEITHPDDLEIDLALARQVIAGEIPHYSIDKRYRRADGSHVWCTLTITPVRGPDQSIEFYSAVIDDISDRKKMECAMRESEERFRLVLDATRDAVWDYDIARHTVWWSDVCRELYGDPPAHADENWEWWASRIAVTDRDRVEKSLRAALAGSDDRWQTEYRYLRKDGVWIHVHDIGFIARDESGAPVRILGTMRDITERKFMENALRESEERFRLAIYSARDAIYDLDFARGTVWWSDPYSEVFGVPPNELRAGWQWWLDRIAPHDRDRTERAVNQAMRRGEEFFEVEYQFQRMDGSFADVKNRGFIARDAHGNVTRILGTTRDLTDQKRAEKRMHDADRMALIGNLASGLSHDMSNIVQPMLSAVVLLARGGSRERTDEALTVLRRCANSLASLTNSVRRLSRDGEASSPQTIDLARWWEENSPLYRAAMPHGVTLKGDITQDGLLIRANPDRLTRAVLNMVVNAAEAITGASTRGGLVTVWSQRTGDGEHILLGVRDNGPGIPPELRQKVVEPMFSTKKQGLSTGMGMSVISGFAKHCGGSVEIHSEPGHGANIILRLPVTTAGVI
jgi:PAS domain S-box-containing protein